MSVMPPENGSGNYVKVVQRIVVRIGLTPAQMLPLSDAAGELALAS
jgi:multidrug resistance efflux pump